MSYGRWEVCGTKTTCWEVAQAARVAPGCTPDASWLGFVCFMWVLKMAAGVWGSDVGGVVGLLCWSCVRCLQTGIWWGLVS